MKMFGIAEELRRNLLAIPSWRKRAAVGAMYALATARRDSLAEQLEVMPPPVSNAEANVDVLTLACERDRVVLSVMLRSLLAHFGTPRSICVVSDGSISSATTTILERLSPAVSVVDWVEFENGRCLPAIVKRFSRTHFFGKKMAVMMTSPRNRPVMYADSDLRFFAGASKLRATVEGELEGVRYMEDAGASQTATGYDQRVLGNSAVLPAVNAGFALIANELDWNPALEQLHTVVESPSFVTEQTLFAITATRNGGRALPREEYVLEWKDQDRPWDIVNPETTVLRHYASPTLRWKLWMRRLDAVERGDAD